MDDDDWGSMPTSNAPAAAPAAGFGDDDFGGFGDAPAAAPAAAPADGFDGFGGEPVAAPAQNVDFGGDSGFGGDDGFGSAPVTTAQAAPAATPVDFSGAGDMFSSAPAPTTAAPPPKKPSMFSNAPVVDNCETTALEYVSRYLEP